jgi:PAS domain S-box-containing protein
MDEVSSESSETAIRRITALCRRTNAPNRDFYDTVTTSLRSISGASFVVFNTVTEDATSTSTMSISGIPTLLSKVLNTTGLLIGRRYRIDDAIGVLADAEGITDLGPMCVLSRHQIPEELCRKIVKIVGDIRVVGLSIRDDDSWYGNILFLLRDDDTLRNKTSIEAIGDVISLWYGRREVALFSSLERLSADDPLGDALRLIPEEVPDLVFGLNPDGTIRFINQAIERYGYKREALIGIPFIDLVHPDDREDSYYHVHERRRGIRKTRDYTLRLVGTVNQTRVLSVRSQEMVYAPRVSLNTEGVWVETDKHRRFVGTVGIGVDITERTILQRELDSRAYAFDVLTRTLESPVWLYDGKNDTIVYLNDACFRLLEYAVETNSSSGGDGDPIDGSWVDGFSSDLAATISNRVFGARNGDVGWYPHVDAVKRGAFTELFADTTEGNGDGHFSVGSGDGSERWYRAEVRTTEVDGVSLSVGIVMDMNAEYETFHDLQHTIEFNQALNRETNHRIKNNLFLIESMLSLEELSSSRRPTEEIIKDFRTRLHAVATVHEMAYEVSSTNSVDLGTYLARLTGRIIDAGAHRGGISFETEIAPCAVTQKTAVPIGMICGELVTNALKYAWPDGGTGTIRLILHNDAGTVAAADVEESQHDLWRVIVEDDGVGLGASAAETTGGPEHIGFGLIHVFAEQVDGRFWVESGTMGAGTRGILEFPAASDATAVPPEGQRP